MLASLYRLFAHEVYVLTPDQINIDKHSKSVHLLDALSSSHNLRIFIIASLLIGGFLGLALWLKSRMVFKKIGKFIDRGGVIAPDIIRIAFGASLIFSAMHSSLFGPELPLSSMPAGNILTPLLFITGVMLVAGLATKIFGFLALGIWTLALISQGWYILTYANYLGGAIATILLPLQLISLDNLLKKLKLLPKKLGNWHSEMAMPVARILFGFSLLYTAVSVKILHPALTLDTVNKFDLTRIFPFDPLFVVLGAALIEILVAALYMLGLLRRATSIVFLALMIASVMFFKESVWPHYLLIAFGLGIFLHSPDKLALDRYIFPYRLRRPRKAK